MTDLERLKYDREIAKLRAGLDNEAFNSAWAEGRVIGIERAIEYALKKQIGDKK